MTQYIILNVPVENLIHSGQAYPGFRGKKIEDSAQDFEVFLKKYVGKIKIR
jgi:hypothetical protein